MLVQINWNGNGNFYYIPLEARKDLFESMGREKYIKLPKSGTNPRGVEITKEALSRLVNDGRSRHITIEWRETEVKFDPYKKWIDLWMEE